MGQKSTAAKYCVRSGKDGAGVRGWGGASQDSSWVRDILKLMRGMGGGEQATGQ